MAEEEAFYELFYDLDSNCHFFGFTDADLEADRERAMARVSASAEIDICESEEESHATRSVF